MDLLLSLGHNSSAIGVEDGKVFAAYEQERFSRKKSDSAMPLEAVNAVLCQAKSRTCETYASHWFDEWDPSSWQSKYWDPVSLDALFARHGIVNRTLYSLCPELTHHDAHAYSALCFARKHSHEPKHVLVLDGFGNKGEVVSLYSVQGTQPKLVHRVNGYLNSLGMLYQYATSFCGMKEHQDEYKFLGYEVLAENYGSLKHLRDDAQRIALDLFEHPREQCPLGQAKESIHRALQLLTHGLEPEAVRPIVGYYVQSVLEEYALILHERFDINDCAYAGGVFYNVKLNNMLSRRNYRSSFCPLAGDQGAAIGLYVSQGKAFDFLSLCWGHRDLSKPLSELCTRCGGSGQTAGRVGWVTSESPITCEKCEGRAWTQRVLPDGVEWFSTPQSMVLRLKELLHQNRIVDMVKGPAEFGPRALCNTSTLCKPTRENVDRVNAMNGRDTVMPMAPVLLDRAFKELFGTTTVHGSFDYMVCAVDYRGLGGGFIYPGVSHPYPESKRRFSARPQIVRDDPVMVPILEEFNVLINTSFNVHGRPIVHTVQHALNDFGFQCAKADELELQRPVLLIGGF